MDNKKSCKQWTFLKKCDIKIVQNRITILFPFRQSDLWKLKNKILWFFVEALETLGVFFPKFFFSSDKHLVMRRFCTRGAIHVRIAVYFSSISYPLEDNLNFMTGAIICICTKSDNLLLKKKNVNKNGRLPKWKRLLNCWPEVSADVIFFCKTIEITREKNKNMNSIHLPALNARIQSRRSFSLATVKYRVYCGIDRPGNWSSTSQ